MNGLVYDEIGAIHLLSSVLALIAGTLVLLQKKGTVLHKRIGYLYVASMLVLIITAFNIYRLSGSFGIFHFAAIVSTLTLLGGMIPVFTRKPKSKWIELHFAYMYWSVMGLYGAFISEIFSRVPETPFWGMVSGATFAVMFLAGIFYSKYGKQWKAQFGRNAKIQVHQKAA